MTVLLVLGVSLVGLALALVLRALALPRARSVQTLSQIGAYGFAVAHTPTEPGSMRASLDALASAVGSLISARFGAEHEARMRVELMSAGLYGMPPRRFLGYRLLCTVCVPIATAYATASIGFPLLVAFACVMAAVVGGWIGPLTIVRKRARRRLERIDFELPELIDLLIVTIEAGLGFNGSLQVAADRTQGPLGDELRLTLQEQSFGLSSTEALSNMLVRADTPGVRSFVRSIIQGESLGVSIGQILRNLSNEMRARRRQAAEERAQRAPIKILFPLIFLIFPAMFVVLLAPAMFRFLDSMKGLG